MPRSRGGPSPETAAGGQPDPSAAGADVDEDQQPQRTSPLVRRIAREHNVDVSRINGTGISGRVTKRTSSASSSPPRLPPSRLPALRRTRSPHGAQAGEARRARRAHVPVFKPGERVEIVPMTIMRKKIAEHMVMSAHTSPHVYSVYEVDFHRLSQLRDRKKADYERNGAKLSFTALIAKATVDAIRAFPFTNASIDGDNIVYKKDINLGIAVALDQGLIVPVIRNADEKNLLGLSRAIDDLAVRARSKKLNPDEVQGGTFTITNPGIFGAVYGLPLINQPQVAILGVGVIEKRAVVVKRRQRRPADTTPSRSIRRVTSRSATITGSIDGADAGRFLTYLKERLEHFDEVVDLTRSRFKPFGGSRFAEVRRFKGFTDGSTSWRFAGSGWSTTQAGLDCRRRSSSSASAARSPITLLLLEHPDVITLGVQDAQRSVARARDARVARRARAWRSSRPAAAATSPITAPDSSSAIRSSTLKPDRRDVHRYVRDLEDVLIRAVADFGIGAGRVAGLTGIWVGAQGGSKLAAIGVRISRWVTSHGFALNVTTDLSRFGLIVPCGITDRGVTSMERAAGPPRPMAEVEDAVDPAPSRPSFNPGW